jgi:hypothetical protein
VTSSLSQGSTARALSLSLWAGQLCKQTAPSRHPSSHHTAPGTLQGLLLPAVAHVPNAAALALLLLLLVLLGAAAAAGLCEKSGSRCEGLSLGLLRSQNHSLPAEGPRSPACAHRTAKVSQQQHGTAHCSTAQLTFACS